MRPGMHQITAAGVFVYRVQAMRDAVESISLTLGIVVICTPALGYAARALGFMWAGIPGSVVTSMSPIQAASVGAASVLQVSWTFAWLALILAGPRMPWLAVGPASVPLRRAAARATRALRLETVRRERARTQIDRRVHDQVVKNLREEWRKLHRREAQLAQLLLAAADAPRSSIEEELRHVRRDIEVIGDQSSSGQNRARPRIDASRPGARLPGQCESQGWYLTSFSPRSWSWRPRFSYCGSRGLDSSRPHLQTSLIDCRPEPGGSGIGSHVSGCAVCIACCSRGDSPVCRSR